MRILNPVCVVVATAGVLVSSNASGEPLTTDRPDATESPFVVGKGRVQIEAGYTFTRDKADGVRTETHVAPEALLRIGLTESLELRLAWEGYAWSRTRSEGVRERDSGGADLEIGAKLEFLAQDGAIPSMGVIASVSAPSGGGDVGAGDWEGTLILAADWGLTERVGLGANLSLSTRAEGERGGDRYFEPGASVALGYDLTEIVGLYLEYFGVYPDSSDAPKEHYLNGGTTILLSENLQLDWRIGFGLNDDADDVFTGVGFSIRF